MAHSALTPVFVGLRAGLHLLFAVLVGLVAVRTLLDPGPLSGAVLVAAVALVVTYVASGVVVRSRGRGSRLLVLGWLVLLTVEWIVLLALTPDAAYLVFPLFFLYLHLLGRVGGLLAVAASTVVAIVTLAVHDGWSVGGIVGPAIGAAVAVMIGFGYQALARESAEREQLVAELLATRDRLAAQERESGILAERARLAREIHDTVAQGLSSIQLLLHAAERADPRTTGIEHIRLARDTAATGLADTRRFIRALTPPDIENEGLGGALRRLAEAQWAPALPVQVRVADPLPMPMHVQTALLRIAQGAVANVIQHADATAASIELALDDRAARFTVTDDGRGFDTRSTADPRQRTDSFGLRATRERVDQLGGTLTVTSAPGRGTVIQVDLPLQATA